MTTTDGAVPEGQWKAALATSFDRSMYVFSIATTAADDATIIAAFNAAPNKSRFNFFYQNCSDQAKGIFDLILPSATGDRTSGITIQTPKGLAKALVSRALAHPELNLRVRRYPQIPRTFSASRDVLFPMENTYRNVAFAPYWFWGGFREVPLGAMFYHEVVSPFDVLDSSRDFMSARAADLTLEQHRLRKQQDALRLALTSTQRNAGERLRLSALYASVFSAPGTYQGSEVGGGGEARGDEGANGRGAGTGIPVDGSRAERAVRPPRGTATASRDDRFQGEGVSRTAQALRGRWRVLRRSRGGPG